MRTMALALVLACTGASPAFAGGYDTPMLYSARHMGMGGTAIGYVDDPSAIFHNPAGLAAQSTTFSILADFSPLFGSLNAPVVPGQQVETEPTFAPFFMLAAGFQVTDFMTLGIAAYPVASAGATYKYDSKQGTAIENRTKLVFFEIAPAISFEFLDMIRFGVAWRASILQFERYQGPADDPSKSTIDLDMSGSNFLGFRAGLQVDILDFLQVGVTYRHETVIPIETDAGRILTIPAADISTDFTLPSKLGFGVRGNAGIVSVAADLEYSFNSQNDMQVYSGIPTGADSEQELLPNVFRWSDALTLRGGLEFSIIPMIDARVGYVYDAKTANEKYPTAFGTPAEATHTITVGVGLNSLVDMLDVNLAYAYRFGSATITEADIDGRDSCPACAGAGDYDLSLHGLYLDVGVNF